MTPKEIAAALTGSEYPLRIAKDIKAAAETSGIVIVFGASDDLMEFEGAISDEVGAWEGTTTRRQSPTSTPPSPRSRRTNHDRRQR